MVNKYYIEGVTQDWLLKPGVVVYVEREYNKQINSYISKNLSHLQSMCRDRGLTFLYIPEFYTSLPYDMLKYYTGKGWFELPEMQTYDILSAILTDQELSQIQEPSLLFTGATDKGCTAYAIGKDPSIFSKIFTSRKEKYLEESIHSIISKVHLYSGITSSLFNGQLFTSEDEGHSVLNEPTVRFRISGSITSQILDEEDEEEVLESKAYKLAQKLVADLLQKGYSKEMIWALLAPVKELSPIKITRDLRIQLPSYNMEIELPPVQKAVYLLFLKHPQGIYFKDMPDFQDELFQIYRKIAVRGAREKHLATIADLVNPVSNSMNEKCSQIKKYMVSILDDSLAKHYYISGSKGELKRIDISPDMIVWE